MDILPKLSLITGLFSMTYILNLPFGYFRGREKKYSFGWFLYIHLPIPFIFFARVFSHLDFGYVPIFVFAAVLGQVSGGRMDF